MSRLRVALLDSAPAPIARDFQAAFEPAGLEFAELGGRTVADRTLVLEEFDYAISLGRPLRAADLPDNGRLRLVQKWGAGHDAIDLEALERLGIGLYRTADVNSGYVAELALSLILSTLRGTTRADRELRQGLWDGQRYYEASSSLFGKIVGFVGLGAIGGRLAQLVQPFGCRVLYASRRIIDDAPTGALRVSLDDLLAQSDIVSLHVPLTDATRSMIGSAQLARMKPGAILINTARGAVVDEAALVEAVRQGVIAGAGLDVFATEPLPPDHALLGIENVTLTPHLGGKVRENADATLRRVVHNITRHAAGDSVSEADVVLAPRSGRSL